jgi:hypothetical protein
MSNDTTASRPTDAFLAEVLDVLALHPELPSELELLLAASGGTSQTLGDADRIKRKWEQLAPKEKKTLFSKWGVSIGRWGISASDNRRQERDDPDAAGWAYSAMSAERILRNQDIRQSLCQTLSHNAYSPPELAKIITPVLLSQDWRTIAPRLTPNPETVAAITLTIMNKGVERLCADYKEAEGTDLEQ